MLDYLVRFVRMIGDSFKKWLRIGQSTISTSTLELTRIFRAGDSASSGASTRSTKPENEVNISGVA